ncbi:xylulokinase [Actimicrobium sp. GrIS 1.19]|uniref:xylulokinase n=1 Tax=Actimicrobium sp. GrIS 1.19 TaxID=3071708 RepID=UPI002DFB7587|nr:xylulokinase [Actimicrobium sp. GrIS 1.19]
MYLGIDLGTSGVKVLLLAPTGRIVAIADSALSVQQPRPLWSEQNPAQWWQALEQAIACLRADAPQAFAQVKAIGLCGQMHGAVVLDAERKVLRPAILWNDGRAFAECAELERSMPDAQQLTGNQIMPGFTAPKLLWLRKHQPKLFARIACVLLPKDWLRLQLTGELVSEMSDASGTLWLNVAERNWSLPMLQACGLGIAQMPRLVEGSAIGGTLLPALARDWGLQTGIPVAGGAGDNAASAIGVGAIDAGQGFVSLGTSGVVFRVTDRFQPNPAQGVHAFAHALPQRWHQMSVMLSAASAFGWVTRLTGRGDEATLAAEVEDDLTPAQRERAPLFLPYLAGERTPHNDPLATAAFVGMRHEHEAAALAFAVMEGVAFGLRDGLEAMAGKHAAADEMTIVGDGARNDGWVQLIASVLGTTLRRDAQSQSAAALGAARLAWIADGGDPATLCRPAGATTRFHPDPVQAAVAAPRFRRF